MNDSEKVKEIQDALDELEASKDKETGRIEPFEQMAALGRIKQIMKK